MKRKLRVARRVVPPSEPNMAAARQWWPDLTNHWTTVGWKDHLFRFNVLFNGSILAEPHLNRRTEAWKDQGVYLSFCTPAYAHAGYGRGDDGLVRQGWKDSNAPVLWSRWAYYGLLFEQQVFAHVSGGGEVVSGIEPLFAWVRYTVVDRLEAIDPRVEPHQRQGVAIRINRPHAWPSMSRAHNITFDPNLSRYPRALSPSAAAYDAAQGLRLVEPDGRVRLALPPGLRCVSEFIDKKPSDHDMMMHVWVEARVGASFDLLVPMLPTEAGVFDAELALGFDGALKQAERFWSVTPATAARIDIPEEPINEVVRRTLQFSQVCAERNPADGCYSSVTGSWAYTNLWPTPNSMTLTMFLDPLGHHDTVAKYLEIFRHYQGSVVAPGDFFRQHPGYLSSPKTLTSIDWLSDHGALLHAVSSHVLLSGDAGFLDRWREAIVKACDFIQYARGITGHGGVEGVMPPAVATDRGTKIQGIWNDGWNYKGYTTAIRLLRRLNHPRAEEFARDAGEYREAFVKAVRAAAARMPVWTDRRGKKHHLAPTSLHGGDTADETRHAFYLDTGPLFLVYAGLFDADDPLMRSTRLWFREGPPWRHFRRHAGCWQVPVLDHEISSCEPCYSWVGYHSHQAGDRERFLTAMYSLFAGVLSQQTYTMCETRGGITGLTGALAPFHLARLAVIDEQLHPGELHLLRLVPAAWVRADRETCFADMPTEFGPVTLRWRLHRGGDRLEVSFTPRFREEPARTLLHLPPIAGLKRIILNGRDLGPPRGGAYVLTAANLARPAKGPRGKTPARRRV